MSFQIEERDGTNDSSKSRWRRRNDIEREREDDGQEMRERRKPVFFSSPKNEEMIRRHTSSMTGRPRWRRAKAEEARKDAFLGRRRSKRTGGEKKETSCQYVLCLFRFRWTDPGRTTSNEDQGSAREESFGNDRGWSERAKEPLGLQEHWAAGDMTF